MITTSTRKLSAARRRGETLGRESAGWPSETIRFAIGMSTLGVVLVALSDKGIVSLQIGEGAERLVEDLQRRFPRALIVEGRRDDEKLLAQVIRLVEKPGKRVELPLDLRGTPFQQRVWNAVRRIPAGQTATYSDIALQVGAARAMRAVGSACSKSLLAIAIPCHRVVRSDGSLSAGYDGGSGRQRVLLDREAVTRSRMKKRPAKTRKRCFVSSGG